MTRPSLRIRHSLFGGALLFIWAYLIGNYVLSQPLDVVIPILGECEAGYVSSDCVVDLDSPPEILVKSYATYAQTGVIANVQFAPFAVLADGSETATLLIELNQAALGVEVTGISGSIFPMLDGTQIQSNDTLLLYDDGTNGDSVAGDNIWSRDGFTIDSQFVDPGELPAFDVDEITITTVSDTETINLSGAFTAMLVGVAAEEKVSAAAVPSTFMQIGPHVYNSYAPGRIEGLATNEATTMRTISTDLLNYLNGEDLDFIIVFPDRYIDNNAFGRAYPVSNRDQNTGRGIYDFTSSYGSSGQLKQVILMNFTGTNGPTLHELLHQWAAFGLQDLGFHSCGAGAHWGRVGVGRGQHGGFDPTTLVDNGDGTYTVGFHSGFANGGDSVPFAQLELYLMGMLPASEVDPIPVPVNIDCDSLTSVDGGIQFAADGIQDVTIEEIQAELGGERLPTAVSAQKAFKVAFVAISDTALTDTELSVFNSRARILNDELTSNFLNSFADATGGLGSIDTATTLPEAALSFQVLSTEPAQPRPGEQVDLFFEVTNSSFTPAANVALTLTLPTEVNLISTTLPDGVSVSGIFPELIFDIDQVAGNDTVQLQVTFAIPSNLNETTVLTPRISSPTVTIPDETPISLIINPREVFLSFIFEE